MLNLYERLTLQQLWIRPEPCTTLSPSVCLTMTGEISGCHNSGRREFLQRFVDEIKSFVQQSPGTGQPSTTRNYRKCQECEVKKAGSRETKHAFQSEGNNLSPRKRAHFYTRVHRLRTIKIDEYIAAISSMAAKMFSGYKIYLFH